MGPDDRTPQEGIREVNMTPLIDVSLVLVVMLLLATPLAFESNIAVKRAEPAAREAVRTEPLERVEVRILDETRLRVNRESVPRDQLAATLAPLLSREAPPPVLVACEDEVPHGTFVSVLDEAKSCGAVEIAVLGE